MDIKTLEQLMIENAVSIRAIPHVVVETYDVRHKDRFMSKSNYQNGRVLYLEKYKREMFRTERIVSKEIAGKFVMKNDCSTGELVRFTPNEYGKSTKYYDTIEDAIFDLINIEGDCKQ